MKVVLKHESKKTPTPTLNSNSSLHGNAIWGAAGVEVKERKSAVKTTIEVTTPPEAGSQFFRVKFGQ